ncbi:MAG: carbon-nitrogen hydrolase family protein [Acidobacteriota bacterium]|nr:carbon-nitrogen hydrolase family protein [Acidobacteriota bacterium]
MGDSVVRIALVQQCAGHDREENRRRGLEALDRAATDGAQIVCFAELAFDRFYPQEKATPESLAWAEPVPGPTFDRFAQRAADRGVVVVLNLFEREGERTFDCSPVIDADGTLLGKTRMVHITDYPCFHEQGYYHPGDCGAPVFATRFGRLGVAICYDRHYPEYVRALALHGAEIVVVPQAGAVDEWPDGLFEAEMRVAAFQNGFFTALVNRVGREERLEFAGESFICDPDGRLVARAGRGTEEILTATLDLAVIDRSHGRRLFLRHRRPELYAEWLGEKES